MKQERFSTNYTLTIELGPDDAGIITSEDDELAGKYCPYCGKTELELRRWPDCTKITLNPQKEGNHQWSLDFCTCKTCWNDWLLYVNETGRRVLIYEKNPSGDDDIDELKDIG
jgi:hypothetical protein